ncbi:MFS transporter [Candidatus Bipolaricaulota bacterium]|nr:MFS transporter [Candidatus Bipolaricaulota bacterium]
MFGFSIVWLGQFVSMIGTGMSRFALTIWAWQVTGEATALALVGVFSFAPVVLFSPLAGAIVDRVNRKAVMIVSDLAAGLSTIAILVLHLTGHLEIWHLYAAGFFAGAFESFQFPAYSAAITTMVDKKHYTRANAMLGMAGSASGIIAPLLAVPFLAFLGINGVLTIDIATFVFAVVVLLFVFIPQPKETATGRASRGNLFQESLFGFKYIFSHSSLLGLQLVFFSINLTATLSMVLAAPLILARTGDNTLILGSVQMLFGIGGLVGGLLISTWGGPKRRVHGVLLGMLFSSLLGQITFGLAQGAVMWGVGAFFMMFFLPLLNGSNQAIWQAKVPPDVQGKVFATRRLIAQISAPIAMFLGGRLADTVFGPGMMPGAALANIFGPLVGTGSGAGMSLMFVFTGLLGALVGLSGYLFPAVRNAEDLLPDHDAVT